MHDLVRKYRVRRMQAEVHAANRALERAVRRIQKLTKESLKRWKPAQEQKTEWLAKAVAARALGYASNAFRLLRARRGLSISEALDLTRTALEHVYAIAILSQERDDGREFLVSWTNRMQARKLRKLLEAPYGDGDDKKTIQEMLDEKLASIGPQASRAKVDDLVVRAKLATAHKFLYAQLSPYSHFDLTKTLEMAYEADGDVDEEMEVSTAEHKCEALHALLAVSVYIAIGCRDFGAGELAEPVERYFKVLRDNEALAYQVDARLGG